MRSPAALFPSIPQAAFLLLASFLLQYAVHLALYDHRHSLGLDEHQRWALVMLASNGLVLATVLHIQRRSHWHLVHASSASVVATTVMVVPAVLMLVPLILHLDGALIRFLESLFPLSRWEEQAFERMSANALGALLATCVLAPVLEEMLFRGVLLHAFLTRYPRWPAIATSALFFGLMHFNLYQFWLAFWVGLLLGWLYERSRSLIPCIALHAALNTGVVMMAPSLDEPGAQGDGFTLGTWVAAALLALLGAAMLRRLFGGSAPEGRTDTT